MIYHIIQNGFDPAYVLSFLIALTIALTVHEFAHAYRADLAGDPTPRAHGRVSLNPLDHFDPIGTTMILIAGFGWGKPVPVNAFRFRHPRRDEVFVSLWGPLSNILVAVVFGLLYRSDLLHAWNYPLFFTIVWLNLALGFFNLLPLYPLDGSHILSALLPTHSARRLDEFYARWGIMVLLLLLLTGMAGTIISVPLDLSVRLLLGGPL
jgi:Zn-dependent protease